MARFAVGVPLILLGTSLLFAQGSDPQALAYASQSIAAMTGGNPISDVTFNGSVTWTAGSDAETGTVLLRALGTTESRMDLSLTSGNRSEIRDASTGTALGQWLAPNNSSGYFATQNCFTDAVWFFPVLGSLSAGPSVVLSYLGQTTWNGANVQHIQSYVNQSVQLPPPMPSVQQLSTIDFYLDAGTLLPTAMVFNAHPDGDPTTNIPVEIDFSSYVPISGMTVPGHIQRYWQGTLSVDMLVSSAFFNTGLSLQLFAIQ